MSLHVQDGREGRLSFPRYSILITMVSLFV